jgi:hypothetical protein
VARAQFGFGGFALRWLFALALVLLTYNPHELSYYHWTLLALPAVDASKAVAGIVLLIAWVIYLRATFRSLGPVGVGLALALFAALVWLLIEQGLLSPDSPTVLVYVILVIVSLVLAVGMSWSYVRRRLTGQTDVDDVDE